MRFMHAAARPDYVQYGNPDIQRFVFGGAGSPTNTHFLIEKDYNGNNQD